MTVRPRSPRRRGAAWRRGLTFVLAVVLVAPASGGAHHEDGPARYVDPFIGTLGAGFVFPGAAVPYGMVQNSPDTNGFFAYTGYQYSDEAIRGFSLIHTQAMGVPEGGQIPIMPTTGDVVTDVRRYQSPFSHAREEASPGYYRVHLDAYGVEAELTAGLRVAMQRYTFPRTDRANVLLDIGRQIAGSGDIGRERMPGTNRATMQIVDARTVVGSANIDRAAPDGSIVHFAARFDRPATAWGTWASRGAAPQAGSSSVTGVGAGAYLRFDTTIDPTVVVKLGVSFVSQANALGNLEDELPAEDYDFEALRARTRAAWNDALGAIVVRGGTPAQKRAFYTALYHAQHHPNVFTDHNGEYIGYDRQIHRVGAPGDPMPPGSTYYANYSFWDSYRAQMPLLMTIAPDRVRDMMRSLAAVVTHGGRIPRWGWMDRYADFMNGEPGINVVADAWCRGLVPDDAKATLYESMRALALDASRHRDPSFLSLGYVPYPGSGASSTLEHAISSFALSLVADAEGNVADAAALRALAENWRNHLDPETRFMRPRFADGTWADTSLNRTFPEQPPGMPPTTVPYRPESQDGWREGTGWQYTWLVPHDARALFDGIGSDLATQRLDAFFAAAHAAGTAGAEEQQKASTYGIWYAGTQYAPSNEHDLQAPWMYNWLGQTWKTQHLARAYQGLYRDTPDGLPGNDDLGTLSAWFVWSALGLYPQIPGAPLYATGSPMFERARVRVPGGTFTIEAPHAATRAYVRALTIDHASTPESWVPHDVVSAGRTLRFTMSPVPEPSFGTTPPPSHSTDAMDAFGCSP